MVIVLPVTQRKRKKEERQKKTKKNIDCSL